ncbi:MAG TPA: membrane protein insertase YidC [Kofleriaceae bacterium]|nr:membrane protein insertase YidC [Kofleriaceae bacterium]
MKMEDQGKRLLLAVAIAFGIMMAWTLLFPPDKPEKPPEKKPEAAATAPGEAAPATAPQQPAAPAGAEQPGTPAEASAPAAAAPVARGEEKLFTFRFDEVEVVFSSYDGALKHWRLLGDQFHVPGDESTAEDLVRIGDQAHPFTVRFTDTSTYRIPAGAEWKGEKSGDREMTFTWESPELKAVKRFRLVPEHYLVELDVDYEVVKGPAKQTLVVSLYSLQDPREAKEGGWTSLPREWKAACYVDGELETHSAKSVAERMRSERGEVKWAGFIHSYFLAAAAPRDAKEQNIECVGHAAGKTRGGMGMDIVYPQRDLSESNTLRGQAKLAAYYGPKYLDKLESIPSVVQFDPGFDEAVDLGFWGFIAGPMLWILQRFHGLVGSWGIAIILLTILVKLATLYWTHKSMKSMKAMAKLRPKLDELRKKYPDDKQKQQVETMNLFKAHGVNPLAGCLPILLQMPIWFALYRALSVAAELYQAKFLWFDDLTAPDPYFILPVFMTATMLLQSKLTPQTATGMQQKILTYGMPLMFGGFSLFFPAGLTLYISTNTVLTLLHHLYMRRDEIFTSKSAAAAAETGSKGTIIEATATETPAASAADDDDDEPAEAPVARPGGGQKNGQSARPRAGQQRRRSGKRSKRGSKSS